MVRCCVGKIMYNNTEESDVVAQNEKLNPEPWNSCVSVRHLCDRKLTGDGRGSRFGARLLKKSRSTRKSEMVLCSDGGPSLSLSLSSRGAA